MVGSMLSRVLSRTKISTSSAAETLNEKIDYTYPQNDTVDNQNRLSTVNGRLTTISFDVQTQGRSMAKAIQSSASSRKHSYASVKEDSEVPQSFRTRRILSHTDVSSERSGFHVDLQDEETVLVDDQEDDTAVYSDSDLNSTSSSLSLPVTLESMPDEILDTIFSYVTLDTNKDRYAEPRVDLYSLLFVSRSIHAAALRVLYRHVKVSQSKAFFKLHNALAEDHQLGSLVQCLDFSHYSNMGFGRARSATIEKPYLTPKTLKACLDRMTNLKAFLVHEHVDDELDQTVLLRLFNMPSLQALDLCGSSSKGFAAAFSTICDEVPLALPNLQRLSLHECGTLRPQVFELLLPRLTRLTHLDVAHTMINDKALLSVSPSARITHLNLERCSQITGSAVVKFLTTHPAARNLIYLNVFADASRYRLLSEEELDELLPALPSTLRSLNIGGARINSRHTCILRKLVTHLEELGLKGANLSLSQDVSHILSMVSGNCDEELEHPEWRHNLRYIDLTDIKSVNQMSLTYSTTAITATATAPLEVIEVGDSVLRDLTKRLKNVKTPEWVVRELGRRGWYVRQPTTTAIATAGQTDDGFRAWKMGARWWGMRKIPVFDQDTGGMYGYFMFKRA